MVLLIPNLFSQHTCAGLLPALHRDQLRGVNCVLAFTNLSDDIRLYKTHHARARPVLFLLWGRQLANDTT